MQFSFSNQSEVIFMAFSLPASVCQLISRLESAGYEAYAVGGCVRDMLCGRTPHDWDLCTSAMPWETKACFLDCTMLTIGGKTRHDHSAVER